MNKSLLIGILAGAVGVTAVGAVAGFGHIGEDHRFAEVVDVKPLTKVVKSPREVCHDEQVTRQAPVKDQHQVAGTVVGAVLGGVLGHQVGGGNGKTIATVAGAAAGGYAGNRVQDKMQRTDTETTTEQRCETVYDRKDEPAGYQVTYKFNGQTSVVHMKKDPGARLPMKDGKPDLKSAEPAAS